MKTRVFHQTRWLVAETSSKFLSSLIESLVTYIFVRLYVLTEVLLMGSILNSLQARKKLQNTSLEAYVCDNASVANLLSHLQVQSFLGGYLDDTYLELAWGNYLESLISDTN